MIEFIEVKNKLQLQLFVEFKIKLMDEINIAALKLGFKDKKLQNYTIDQAQKSTEMKDNFLISYKDNYIGNFQVSIRESLCEIKEVVYLHNVYIKEPYRNLGIGRDIINYISTSYKKPIECECWYEMDSLNFFKNLGFFKVRITFYSDQNCISENKK
jgi:N-acetylglutamate synthase-like GNAT family acetyltransferase